MTTTAPADRRARLQRRVVTTLIGSQILGGMSLTAGVAVGPLLAERLSGSATWAGLGGTFQVLGSALLAIPIAAVCAARGRRPGLVLGYAAAVIGALGTIASAVWGSFPLFLVSAVLFGGATASNSTTRYAAADLALPERRARDLSVVVWATTIGSVAGPNLTGPAAPVARALGIPSLAGAYVFSVIGLFCAIAVLLLLLRPDPLLESRRLAAAATDTAEEPAERSVLRGLTMAARIPQARLGLLTLALGHGVMVSVMVMTPLHMAHGQASLELIGFVISVHVLGMFAFSPLTGLAVDRFGGRAIALVGSMILSSAALLASTAPTGHSNSLLAGLFLLGLGWSCTFVSGSSLLTGALTPAQRPAAQGAADVLTGLSAALGGAVGGVIVAEASYHVLALAALGFAVAVGLVAALTPTAARERLLA